jgi:hypothetical protein
MPSHRTDPNARIGDSRGGHIAPHVGKGGSQPMSLKRRDNDLDLRPPEPTSQPPANTPVAGENRNVIEDSRRR